MVEPKLIRLGISTCPNDTFTFFGLLTGKTDTYGLKFDIVLQDVQELNDALFQGQFDVAKASFHAALLLSDDVGVLPSGSALGYGVGPLLLSARPGMHPGDSTTGVDADLPRVLCPGQYTTAALLYRLFHQGEGRVEHCIFSDIMPALRDGVADFGVCIHEGRFTWEEQGLGLVEDLGSVWESQTNTPLPLGGIVARHALGQDVLRRVHAAIRASLEFALGHRAETRELMRQYAQELADDVLFAHVDLYVNEWSVDLGPVGRQALRILAQRARDVGVLSAGQRELAIVGN